jgi:hypothetical protein
MVGRDFAMTGRPRTPWCVAAHNRVGPSYPCMQRRALGAPFAPLVPEILSHFGFGLIRRTGILLTPASAEPGGGNMKADRPQVSKPSTRSGSRALCRACPGRQPDRPSCRSVATCHGCGRPEEEPHCHPPGAAEHTAPDWSPAGVGGAAAMWLAVPETKARHDRGSGRADRRSRATRSHARRSEHGQDGEHRTFRAVSTVASSASVAGSLNVLNGRQKRQVE